MLYSSGDDVTMCVWDVRQLPRPSARLSSPHTAGISTLASCPHAPDLLASGSYDECIRLWDVRVLARPMAVCQVAMGGGVWRVKWHPQRADVLLAACMHGGAAVVQLSEGEAEGGMRGSGGERYDGHQSMVYGADWWTGGYRRDEREGDGGGEGRGEYGEQTASEDGEEWMEGEHEAEEEEEEEEEVEEAVEGMDEGAGAENDDTEDEECGSPSNLHVSRPFASVYGRLASSGVEEEPESHGEGERAEGSAVRSWRAAEQRKRGEERRGEEGRPVVVTCSFYDQSLQVWAPGAA